MQLLCHLRKELTNRVSRGSHMCTFGTFDLPVELHVAVITSKVFRQLQFRVTNTV